MDNTKLRVCEQCFSAICSREGDISHYEIYVDENDKIESTCDWCKESGFDVLHEIIRG